MKKYRLVYAQQIGLALTLCGAITCLAQPVMSRGQQQLPVNYAECLNRARQALKNAGFTVSGAGNFAQGFKEASGTYITCNEIPGSGTVVNIFVASIANDDGVPGSLRQCLQAQMANPGSPSACATGGCGLGTRWEETEEGWNAIWTRRGNSNTFDVRSKKGDMTLTAVQTIEMNGNKVKVTRTNSSDGNNCQMTGTVAPDGIHVSGSYDCTSGKGYSWSATIRCQ